MKYYKLRAECMQDIVNFSNVFKLMFAGKVNTLISPGVEYEFKSPVSLNRIVKILKQITDGHVMVETIQEYSKYTGERKQKTDKAIILLGAGRNTISELLVSGKDVVFISSVFNKADINKLDINTDFIVFKDFNIKKYDLEEFFSYVTNGFPVKKRGGGRFNAYPKIIITCDCTIPELRMGGPSYDSRFDVFEIN